MFRFLSILDLFELIKKKLIRGDSLVKFIVSNGLIQERKRVSEDGPLTESPIKKIDLELEKELDTESDE